MTPEERAADVELKREHYKNFPSRKIKKQQHNKALSDTSPKKKKPKTTFSSNINGISENFDLSGKSANVLKELINAGDAGITAHAR